MMLLAQQTLPDPNNYASAGWVLAVVFGLATGALVLKQLFKREPALTEEFVTRREFNAMETRLDEKIDGLGEQITKNNTDGERRVSGIHSRMNELLGAVSELKGILKHLEK